MHTAASSRLPAERSWSFSSPSPSPSPCRRPATRTKRAGKEVESLHHQLFNRGHSNPTISIVMLLNKPACQKVSPLFSFIFSFPSFLLSFFLSFFIFRSYGFFVSYREPDRKCLFTLYTRPLFLTAFSLSLSSLVSEEYS